MMVQMVIKTSVRILSSCLILILLTCCEQNYEPKKIEDIIKNVIIYDVNNGNEAADIRVKIESTMVEMVDSFFIYIMHPNLIANFDLGEASGTQYRQLVEPGGVATYFNLENSVRTIDGKIIEEPNPYAVIVLVKFKAEFKIANQLSASSNNLFLKNDELRDLYVSSRNTNSVLMFDGQTGEYLGDFITANSGELELPQDMYIGTNGNFFVSGRGNYAIKEYDGVTGEFIQDFTNGYLLDEPTKMSINPDGMLLVSQWGQTKSSVAAFDSETGTFVEEIIGNLNQGMDHYWSDTSLYVVSYGSRDLKRYTHDGVYKETLIGPADLGGPVNIWGGGSFLFIADYTDGTIKRYSLISKNINVFISGLTTVEGFAIDSDRDIYLCDWSQNSIRKYSSDGQFIETLVRPGRLRQPNAIVLGPNRNPPN